MTKKLVVFGRSEVGSPCQRRMEKKVISAFVLQMRLRRETQFLIQQNQAVRERTAAIRAEVQDLRQHQGLLKKGVSMLPGRLEVMVFEAGAGI